MRTQNWVGIVRKLLALAALVGVVLFGWLSGHILRFSIPALWHPPMQQMNPQIEYGAEFDFAGIRRLAVFPGLASMEALAEFERAWPEAAPSSDCQGYTFFTSLPPKCLTADGRLITLEGFGSNLTPIQELK